jgi:hypothetical protein
VNPGLPLSQSFSLGVTLMLLTFRKFFSSKSSRRRQLQTISLPAEILETRTVLSPFGLEGLLAPNGEAEPTIENGSAWDATLGQDLVGGELPTYDPGLNPGDPVDPGLGGPGLDGPDASQLSITGIEFLRDDDNTITVVGLVEGPGVTVVLTGAIDLTLSVDETGRFESGPLDDTSGIVFAVVIDADGNESEVLIELL